MGSSLQLLRFSTIQSLMMVDSLPLQSLDLCLELLLLHLVVILLSIRPLLYPLRLLFVKGEFLLFQVVVFIDLGVFHLELGNIVSRFVFVCF